MSKLSQAQKIIEVLKVNPLQKLTARQISEKLIIQFKDEYTEKRQNPRFVDNDNFISQIVAEIGARKDDIIKKDPHVFWQDKPRPRIYWYDPDNTIDQINSSHIEEDTEDEIISIKTPTEQELYPLLIAYLKSELKLYCQRINEKRSKNTKGSGGNQWLHPDIVAMQTVDKDWDDLVRSCIKQSAAQSVRLWSFEVKKELNGSNARKSFFQAVSNSSWANEGYLVATSIADSVEQELRMLSALHGIGIILLNPENPSESDMILPAKSKAEIDWQSVNRILVENADFKDYIELVSTYYQTGRVRPGDWNKT